MSPNALIDDGARALVGAAPVARLATVTADGRPHVVPICFALDGDTLYSVVDAKPKTTTKLRRLANIRANPNVELVVDHYDDDWSQLWWARLTGTAAVVQSGPDWARGIGIVCHKYDQYQGQSVAGAVIVVDVARWQMWRAEPLQ